MVFGVRPIIELIKVGKEIDKILVNMQGQSMQFKILNDLIREHKIPCHQVPIEKLNRITRKNHQGVVAYLSAISFSSLDHVVCSAFASGKSPLLLILDSITDMRNFGAIARTALCAGVDGIITADRGSARMGSDAMKTSTGALAHIPVCREKDLKQTIRYLQYSGLKIFACTEKAAQSIYTVHFNIPAAIILGSEEKGISQSLLKQADHLAGIPVSEKMDSLNVSVAAGVVLFEAVRQRTFM